MVARKAMVFFIVVIAVMGFSLTIAFVHSGLSTSTGPQGNLSTSSSISGTTANNASLQGTGGFNTMMGSGNVSPIKAHNTAPLASNISSQYLFMPNLNASEMYTIQNGSVTPLYTSAPAPMGISDFGVKSTNQGLTAYNLSTSSFEGAVSMSSLQALYPINTDPSYVSIQLNTVLNNVTLFGSSSYDFWTQNVILYSSTTHVLRFEDNIWNFTNVALNPFISSNAVYSSSGNVIPDLQAHIAVGPTIQTSGTFTVLLYINSTLINNRNAVYFNYSIPQMGLSGTYDQVIFNSTYGAGPGFVTPQSNFLVSGSRTLSEGLLYDAELTLGGPGGGSTTNLMNINASMALKYLNETTSTYDSVPSAVNYGADTAETSSGASVYWTSNDVAHLYTGPSILQGMWGMSTNSGSFSVSGKIAPSNGFMFLNPGSTQNDYTAQWVPVQPSGSYHYMLSPGTYTAQVLASDYEPLYNISVSGSAGSSVVQNSINLVKNDSYGGYTPLYAYSNSQLADISASGTGTPANPYVLLPQANLPIMFGRLSLQLFPVFSGVFLYNTTAHVTTAGDHLAVIQNIGGVITLPFNTMPLVFDQAQNVNVTGEHVYGSFGPFLQGFPTGEVSFYNSSHDTISGNTFTLYPYNLGPYTLGLSIIGSQHISVTGNQFTFDLAVALESSTVLSGNTFTGALLFGYLSGYVGEYGTITTMNGNLFQGSFDESVYGGSQHLEGNVFTAYTGMPKPGFPSLPSELFVLNSTVTSYMDSYFISDLFEQNSNLYFKDSSIVNSFFLPVGGAISINNSYLSLDDSIQLGGTLQVTGSGIYSSLLIGGSGMLDFSSDTLVSTSLSSTEGTASLISSNIVNSTVLVSAGNFTMANSQMVNGVVEAFNGNFTMVHSRAQGFILLAFFSNVAITESEISNGNMPSPLDPAVQDPWIISLEYSTGYFYGDTFGTIDYYATLQNYTIAQESGFSYNALSLIFTNAVVTHCNFISVGGNQGGALLAGFPLAIDGMSITHNLFISYGVSKQGNFDGYGSTLLVSFRGTTVSQNRFISIHSPAPSTLIELW